MTRTSFACIIDALIMAIVYLVAVALAVPLLALNGMQRVRRWLGRVEQSSDANASPVAGDHTP